MSDSDEFLSSSARGPCKVIHYSDVHKVREYAPTKDTFFYVLTYNPETRRLASTQGEIRVGPSHQVSPELKTGRVLRVGSGQVASRAE